MGWWPPRKAPASPCESRPCSWTLAPARIACNARPIWSRTPASQSSKRKPAFPACAAALTNRCSTRWPNSSRSPEESKEFIMRIHMKSRSLVFAGVIALSLALHAAEDLTSSAPPPVPPPAGEAKFSAAELEKLAAPIALHSDTLIGIILPAATHPLEIVQAARFVNEPANIPKVDEQPWDQSVKDVAKIPAVIQQMDKDISWTMNLGNAYLDQTDELLGSIQSLRAKAQKNGALQSSEQQNVVVTNTVIEKTVGNEIVYVTNTIVQIEPSNPSVVYVPSYPPTVYYAPPPPPGLLAPPVVTFGVGIAVGAIIANNNPWHHPPGGPGGMHPPPG